MRSSWRIPALLVLGVLLMQAAWVLALPPFRGTDEFDHAYRAAAVADGQWRSSGQAASHGRGELVTVPRALVAAARPVCASYTYTGHDNCFPAADAGAGRVQVASAAATYNPVFYLLVGSVARPFGGDTALYAMRVATAVLCAVFVGLAGWATGLWARSAWPWAGLVVAASPVAVFSTAVVAPNGLEMCAALSLWTALLGLHSAAAVDRHQRALLVTATLSAVVLTTLRSIGPLWLALIVLTALLPLGVRGVLGLVRRTPVLVGVCATLVLGATLASVAWTRSAGTNGIERFDTDVTNRWTATLGQLPLWLLQSIAAFPRRGDPAPGVVYVCAGLVFVSFVVAGFVAARRRWRLMLGVAVAVAVGVPSVTTVLTIVEAGPVWQGRYGLPYAFGVALVAGAALERGRSPHQRKEPLVIGWCLLLVAQVVSVVHVLRVERITSPLVDSTDWVSAPTVVVGLLMAVGFALWGAAVLVAGRGGELAPDTRPSDNLAA